MAMALDSDGDKEIDYREFKKLRRRFKLTEPIRKAADLEYYEEPSAQLKPCPNCSVGLWEPVADEILGYSIFWEPLNSGKYQICEMIRFRCKIYIDEKWQLTCCQY